MLLATWAAASLLLPVAAAQTTPPAQPGTALPASPQSPAPVASPPLPAPAAVPSAQELYEAAQAADKEARQALGQGPDQAGAALASARAAVQKYRLVVLRHPNSGYCDDALWYGALLSTEAFTRFGQDRDRKTAVSLFKALKSEYPLSPFVARVQPRLDRLDPRPAAPAAANSGVAAPPATKDSRPAAAPVQATHTPPAPAPAAPAANAKGGYSLARQLGLRVGRVVIDPGHGGNDPGALGPGISESAITLDIALKLEALLTADQSPLRVVLTRRSDVYVPLQERTAIANRENADLFVSIHVNAHADRNVRGIETYLLNFASTPGAAVVAARENAASTMNMSHLNDVVKQIATASKVDESQDLARQVQASMVKRLKSTDTGLRDLGVKQAPFVVLLGASMPSVLVEVAFLTNRQEEQLLSTPAYRQQVAESLADGIGRYLRALKKDGGIAGQPGEKLPSRLP